jgi:hypothetical protein
MMDNIENYRHLWSKESDSWALYQLNPGTSEEPQYVVIDRYNKSVLVIENDSIAAEVKKRMRDSGVPVVWLGHGF